MRVLSRICTSCDLAALDVTNVAAGEQLIEIVHCRLCDGRRCRECLTPATAASEAFGVCHYCAAPIPPLASAA